MEKYLFNSVIHGYNQATVNEFNVSDKHGDLIVVVIDSSCDNNIGSYYKLINNALKLNNRVILIGIEDDNKSFRPLASLMVTYNAYDIYEIPDKDSLSAAELLKIEGRTPDLSEVQTFIGGDVTAYSDMSTILFGIESLVDEGNEDKLKGFLEEHMLSIENLTSTLNSMKKTCDIFNSNELIDKVNSLKEKQQELTNEIADKDKQLDTVKHDRDQFKVESSTLKRENEKLKSANSNLKSEAESGSSVIKTYKEINTQLIQCKTHIVLYFKEISYVPYVNTLVSQLYTTLERRNLKVKLLIYDSQTSMYQTYGNLNVVSGSNYASLKSALIGKTKQFVISEPNPTILQDILTSDRIFDVVIIYDRMKGFTDIVSGNNVTKFYIINSKQDYDSVKGPLKINDLSYVITHAHSSIEVGNSDNRKFLDIPFIEGYSKQTEAAKASRYMKLQSSFTKVNIIKTILSKSRIDTLYNE